MDLQPRRSRPTSWTSPPPHNASRSWTNSFVHFTINLKSAPEQNDFQVNSLPPSADTKTTVVATVASVCSSGQCAFVRGGGGSVPRQRLEWQCDSAVRPKKEKEENFAAPNTFFWCFHVSWEHRTCGDFGWCFTPEEENVLLYQLRRTAVSEANFFSVCISLAGDVSPAGSLVTSREFWSRMHPGTQPTNPEFCCRVRTETWIFLGCDLWLAEQKIPKFQSVVWSGDVNSWNELTSKQASGSLCCNALRTNPDSCDVNPRHCIQRISLSATQATHHEAIWTVFISAVTRVDFIVHYPSVSSLPHGGTCSGFLALSLYIVPGCLTPKRENLSHIISPSGTVTHRSFPDYNQLQVKLFDQWNWQLWKWTIFRSSCIWLYILQWCIWMIRNGNHFANF